SRWPGRGRRDRLGGRHSRHRGGHGGARVYDQSAGPYGGARVHAGGGGGMAPVTGRLTRGDLNRIFARALFIQAAMHRRGMQSLGMLNALEPGAARVSNDPAALLARHSEHFNTNPNMAPMVIGGVLRIEEEGGRGGPASVSRFTQACASALAAAGDVFFAGGLRPIALTLATLFAI